MKPRLVPYLLTLGLSSPWSPALGDAPAFDRPGIAFAASTLPAGGFSIEQGLPDFVRDRRHGEESRLYSAASLLRFGLLPGAEIQFGSALFNHLETDGSAGQHSDNGVGDSRIALKASLPSSAEAFTWALLAGVGLDSGDEAFTTGATQYSLGFSGSWALRDDWALSLYANGDRLSGDNSWTFSPNLSFGLGDSLSAYVESAATIQPGSNDYVAGGGLAWMLSSRVQIDLYADLRLTPESTDLSAGCGVSIYFGPN